MIHVGFELPVLYTLLIIPTPRGGMLRIMIDISKTEFRKRLSGFFM